ncbi:MAG: L-lactate dehydrogenase [Actinomycetota bacterium]|nr:L-lactate dehydrogenase [Actinomycetota bacterium]
MTKVAIVGAGAVGSAIAYAAQIRGVCENLALYDLNAVKVRAEVLDLNHGMQFTPMTRIEGGDDLEVCRDSDVIVVTAGAKQQPGQSRLDLAAANVAMCRTLVPRLVEVAPSTLLLMVTNPVDVVTMAALRFSGLGPRRVLGSGTVLDSSRLRFLLAQRTGVAVQNVHAYIAGEHGDSEVPLWSSATIAGVPVCSWPLSTGETLDADACGTIHAQVVNSAYEIIEGKGATSLAVGLAVSRILEAILKDEHRVLPVSSLLHGVEGLKELDGVCLSMPSIVGRYGVGRVLPVPLSDGERQSLVTSADAVRAVAADLGVG